jgi:hypothetical protein
VDRNKHLNKLSERLNNLYPDAEDKEGLGVTHWKGKKIIPVKEWKKIALPSVYEGRLYPMVFSSDGLQSFPDSLVEFALSFEGCSVDPWDKSIYPYHDGDPLPGTDEYKQSLGPERKLSAAELKLWQTRLEESQAKAKKEDPFEIWIEEYKELLAFKKIELPVHDDTHIV